MSFYLYLALGFLGGIPAGMGMGGVEEHMLHGNTGRLGHRPPIAQALRAANALVIHADQQTSQQLRFGKQTDLLFFLFGAAFVVGIFSQYALVLVFHAFQFGLRRFQLRL